MSNPILGTLVKNRIFLREGTLIESLIQYQRKNRPITIMYSVCTGNRSLLENFRVSQASVNNCPKTTFAVQLFHEASSNIVIVLNDVTASPMIEYVKEQVVNNHQPGFVLVNQIVNFIDINGDKLVIGAEYDGSVEYVERYASWIAPEFNVTGYIDNSNSYKQEMDHHYGTVQ